MADRRNWTEKQKKEHVAAYRAGSLQMREYCLQEGAPGVSSLSRWCRRITESGRSRPRPRAAAPASDDGFVVSAAGGAAEALRLENELLKKLLARAWAGEA